MYGNVTNIFKTTGHNYKRETTSLPFSGHFLGITCYDINLVAQLDQKFSKGGVGMSINSHTK